jgi:hypothetical protein
MTTLTWGPGWLRRRVNGGLRRWQRWRAWRVRVAIETLRGGEYDKVVRRAVKLLSQREAQLEAEARPAVGPMRPGVTVTADGRTVADGNQAFEGPEVQDLLRAIREQEKWK